MRNQALTNRLERYAEDREVVVSMEGVHYVVAKVLSDRKQSNHIVLILGKEAIKQKGPA